MYKLRSGKSGLLYKVQRCCPVIIKVGFLPGGGAGGAVTPYKSDGGARQKFSRTPLKVPESCFMGVSQIHFHL